MMRPDEFTDEPQSDDALQVAGDIALDALRVKLKLAGIDVGDYSAVISINHGPHLATCMSIGDEYDGENEQAAAFDVQLMHLTATAKALGVTLRVIPIGGQG